MDITEAINWHADILRDNKELTLTPDNRIKKLERLIRDPFDFSDDEGMWYGAVRVKGQKVQGWRMADGRFRPHNASTGFLFLIESGVLSRAWIEAATDPVKLDFEILAKRRAKHDCPINDYALDAMREASVVPTTKLVVDEFGLEQPVHGAQPPDGAFVLFGHCPNAKLWT